MSIFPTVVLCLGGLVASAAAGCAEPDGPAAGAEQSAAGETPPVQDEPRQGARRVPGQVEADPERVRVELPEDLRQRLIADAARRSGVPETAVAVGSAEAVTWPDGSMGCPQPGVMYTQMVVSGYRVIVRAGGKKYDYRAGKRGDFQLCVPKFGELEPRPLPPDATR